MSDNMDADRALIRAAMKYRSGEDRVNTVYMGSIATAGLYHTLGLKYGVGPFEPALAAASREQLDQLLLKCRAVIDHMAKYPTEPCPHCGQIMPKCK